VAKGQRLGKKLELLCKTPFAGRVKLATSMIEMGILSVRGARVGVGMIRALGG
jgi:hypothetical protein